MDYSLLVGVMHGTGDTRKESGSGASRDRAIF
jgi:hypothetical protein